MDKKKEDVDFIVEKQLLARRTRVVIGEDDRRRVDNTLQRPFLWVCQIFAKSSAVSVKAVGSGAVIGRRTILTAAHNLWIKGRRAERFDIYLAVDGDRNSPPLRHYVTGTAVPHPRYEQESAFDIALIFLDHALPSNLLPPPRQYGALPLAEVEPNTLGGQLALVTGYPKSYPEKDQDDPIRFPEPSEGVQAFQYYCASELRFDNKLIRYDLDTTEGQSGSPLIALQQDSHGREFSVVIGVHVEGNDVGNGAVPLDAERMQFVTDMLARGESGSFV